MFARGGGCLGSQADGAGSCGVEDGFKKKFIRSSLEWFRPNQGVAHRLSLTDFVCRGGHKQTIAVQVPATGYSECSSAQCGRVCNRKDAQRSPQDEQQKGVCEPKRSIGNRHRARPI